jgi:hypothetical protein
MPAGQMLVESSQQLSVSDYVRLIRIPIKMADSKH